MLLDQNRCRGYQECVRGCPYKKVYFNAKDDKTLAGLFALFGSTERTIPFFKIQGDAAVALDDDHKAFARVPLYEPGARAARGGSPVSDRAQQHHVVVVARG